jgi:hypothetical protein
VRILAILRGLLGLFNRTVLAVLLVLSLSLTLLSLTVSGVQLALSGALSAAGITTVAAREAAAATTRRTATRQITQQTTRRVTGRIARGAARSSASVVGEAIPVIGVAVIAGALAYEVRDACETARDMAGLEAAAMTDGDPEAAFAEASAAFVCTDLIPDADALLNRAEIWARMTEAPGQAWERMAVYYDDLPDVSMAATYAWMLDSLDAMYRSLFGADPATRD